MPPQPLPKPKPPKATEEETVTAQRVIVVPGRTLRVPALDGTTFSGNTTILKTGARTVLETYDAYPQYTNPDVMAKNLLVQTPEGPQLQKIQELLYNAGYYDSNDRILFGRRSLADVSALQKAMQTANIRGNSWKDEALNRIAINNASGINPYGTVKTTGTGGGSAGGASVVGQINVTGPNQARSALNAMSMKYTGKKIDDKTFSQFYDALTTAQKKAPIKYEKKNINGSVYSVQVSDSIDVNEFAENYIFNKINFASGDLAGIAADNLTAVGKLAAMYDVSLSVAEKSKFAKLLTTGDSSDTDIRRTLANRAKLKYAPIAGQIDETVTTKDLLQEHINAYTSVLELEPNQVKLSDVAKRSFKDGKLISSLDLQDDIRNNDPRYRTTKEARNNAAAFAVGFARTLGYGV